MKVSSEGPTKITKATIDAAWRRKKPDHRLIVRDKDCREVCQILAPLAQRILLAPVKSQRTASAKELAEMCRAANASAEPAMSDVKSLYREDFVAWSKDQAAVVVAARSHQISAAPRKDSILMLTCSIASAEHQQSVNLCRHHRALSQAQGFGGGPQWQ